MKFMRILGVHNVPERLLVVSAVEAQPYSLTYLGMYVSVFTLYGGVFLATNKTL